MTPFPVEGPIGMESWDVLVLGDGPAALRAAISAADAGANPLLVSESSVGSASGHPPLSGLAASLNETNPSSHIQDTISAGGETTNEEAATRICSSAVENLAELERWGLVLRRSPDGSPH
ncbi:MAG: FAD-binding protein, partial [Candidatus Thermoplasmatota archaeon]|nr:FAD-binding protein [Candidatus Thermoplasmatota archaeon]